jgi:hypothetical protein
VSWPQVLGIITGINVFGAGWGLRRLLNEGAFKSFGGGTENILWLGVVFAFVDSVPVRPCGHITDCAPVLAT